MLRRRGRKRRHVWPRGVVCLLGVTIMLAGALTAGAGSAAADGAGGWPVMPVTSPVVPVSDPTRICTVPVPVYPASVAPSPGKRRYIALGDSYSAGEGAPEHVTDSCGTGHDLFVTGTQDPGNHCHRSPHAYPVELARRLGPDWGLDDRACSGATTQNFDDEQKNDQPPSYEFWKDGPPGNPPQWPTDDPAAATPQGRADLITLTMGGNDLGFADIVTHCIALGNVASSAREREVPQPCQAQEDEFRDKLGGLQKNLTAGLSSMVTNGLTPGGKVLIMGYPHVFPDDPPLWCSVGAVVPILREDMLWLNSVAERANDVVRKAAADSGATYVDASRILTDGGHDGCVDDGSQRWINRTIPSDKDWSWHPKAAAHAAEAELLARCLPVAVPRGTCEFPPAAPQVAAPDPMGPSAQGDPGSWPIRPGERLAESGPEADTPYVAYARDRLDCASDDGGPGLGARVAALGYGDADNDGDDDAVVSLECIAVTGGWPQTVLVLDGSGSHDRAPIMATLVDGSQPPRQQVDEITVDRGSVALSGTEFPGRGSVGDQRPARHAFTWSGTTFDPAPTATGGDSLCPPDHPTRILQGATTSSRVAICGAGEDLRYVGSSSAGDIVLPARRIGSDTYEATNTEDGSTYVYQVDPSRLTITRDGTTISSKPLS